MLIQRINVVSIIILGTISCLALATQVNCHKNLDAFSNSKGPKTVLVVDDDDEVRVYTEILVEDFGYRVLAAQNGEEAVGMFQKEQPDMVLMDVIMPGMNGYETTRRIKELSKDRFTPVLFLTKVPDEDDLAKCLDCGGDDFLSKPVNKVILKSRLSSWGRHASDRAELRATRLHLQSERSRMIQIMKKVRLNKEFQKSHLRLVYTPLEETSGDLVLSKDAPGGIRNIIVGDFTGHGLTASVGAPHIQDTFNKMINKGYNLEEVIRSINKWHKQRMPADLFFAMSAIEYNPKTQVAKIINHGLPTALVFKADGTLKESVTSDGMSLGILPDELFDIASSSIALNKGERVFLFTDGITETINQQQQMYGEARLQEKITEIITGNLSIDILLETLDVFRKDQSLQDDITVLEFTAF